MMEEEAGSEEVMIYGKSEQQASEDLGNKQSSLPLARGLGLEGLASALYLTRLVWACPLSPLPAVIGGGCRRSG